LFLISRLFNTLLAFILVLCISGMNALVYGEETKRIGILVDGPYWENEKLLSSVKEELSILNEGRYTIVYAPESHLNGKYDLSAIEKYARELVTDHNLDSSLRYWKTRKKLFLHRWRDQKK